MKRDMLWALWAVVLGLLGLFGGHARAQDEPATKAPAEKVYSRAIELPLKDWVYTCCRGKFQIKAASDSAELGIQMHNEVTGGFGFVTVGGTFEVATVLTTPEWTFGYSGWIFQVDYPIAVPGLPDYVFISNERSKTVPEDVYPIAFHRRGGGWHHACNACRGKPVFLGGRPATGPEPEKAAAKF